MLVDRAENQGDVIQADQVRSTTCNGTPGQLGIVVAIDEIADTNDKGGRKKKHTFDGLESYLLLIKFIYLFYFIYLFI
jgi:hypothetical protein